MEAIITMVAVYAVAISGFVLAAWPDRPSPISRPY